MNSGPKKKRKHKKQRKADTMHVRGREAVRTETKAAGFKQRIGYGGNGVKAIMAEEFASFHRVKRSVRWSDDSAAGN